MSGGALGIGVTDRILMMEHSIYSVISPEGCAAILWRSAEHRKKAATALRLTATDLVEAGVCDEIVAETCWRRSFGLGHSGVEFGGSPRSPHRRVERVVHRRLARGPLGEVRGHRLLQGSLGAATMTGFAEISFKGTRKEYYAYSSLELLPGQHVIVEADRGEDLGEVTATGAIAERKCSSSNGGCATPAPEKKVMRLARKDEVSRAGALRSDEDRVRAETRKLVTKHKLKMKVTEAEWQFDRNKLIIYFTAEKRVDFRELVRDLARSFRARIELKQIGVRDEAALLGGVGPVRSRVMLLHVAPGTEASESPVGKGPAALAEPVPDQWLLRSTHVLLDVRAPHLRGSQAALPPRGKEDPHGPGRGTCHPHRHLA